jgi:ubiquinone/menaquinone biosynthesis C-methylase UbiE
MKYTPTRLIKALIRRIDLYLLEPFRNISRSRLAAKKAAEAAIIEEAFVAKVANMCGGFEGLRVLEIGADQKGRNLLRIVNNHKAKEAVGVNLDVKDAVLQENCRVMYGDMRKTNFDDNSFDVLFSTAVFEHIHNFDVALEEMYRIMKPGGILYSNHGPVWSTSYGHHLWTRYGGVSYTYWNVILPPHCHLLMQPEEVMELCLKQGINPEAAKKLTTYIFESEDQNRLMYDDYARIIKASKFEILLMRAYDTELGPKYMTKDFITNLETLRKKFPGYEDFYAEGMTVLLRKPKA